MIMYDVYVDCVYYNSYDNLGDALLRIEDLAIKAKKIGDNFDIGLRVNCHQNERFFDDC